MTAYAPLIIDVAELTVVDRLVLAVAFDDMAAQLSTTPETPASQCEFVRQLAVALVGGEPAAIAAAAAVLGIGSGTSDTSPPFNVQELT